jgi:mono/diheme cytochrome c family protein
MLRSLPKLLAALISGAGAFGLSAAEPGRGSTVPKSVQSFLVGHCVKCHGAEKPKGDLSLSAISGDVVGGQDVAGWVAVAERLKAGDMPPEGEKQPAPEAIRAVTDWIDAELAKAGKKGELKAGSLKTGNHVPHELLFDPKAEFPLDNPPRLWRISPFIYQAMAKDINKNLKLSQPFSLPAGDGFKDQSAGAGIDASTLAQLLRNAETIVDDQLGLAKKPGTKKLPVFQPLLDESVPATAKQIDAAITAEFELALKRKPTAEELKRFSELHAKNVRTGGGAAGTRVTLMAVLLLPEAVYRMELGSAETRQLTPRERAFAIAYALTDRAPDGELLKAADAGRLATKEDIAREVNRLFADSKVEKPRMLRFFREYFGYADAVNVFKNDKDFQGHKANILVQDTDRLIESILATDKDVFRELLTTNKAFVSFTNADAEAKKLAEERKKFDQAKVNDPKKMANRPTPGDPARTYYGAYNLAAYPPQAQQPVELPKEQRAGILTQPSWLVAMSDNTDNHAIKRGKWIRERLLGGTVPDLPIGVDAQLPEDPHKTLRERMAKTKEAYCWQCHAKMNPLGLGFENFDHFGRWRDTELNKPVDASAVVDRTGDKAVEGNYPNSLEMIRKIAESDRARQVFIRHAFRYWIGRSENLGDAKTLQAADAAYLKSGGSMKALVVSLLTSDSLLVRTGN